MTPDREALRAAAKAATPGPWVVWSSLYEHMDAQLRSADTTVEGVALAEFYRLANGYRNAAFIALANPKAILTLLDERDALVGALEKADQECQTALQIMTASEQDWSDFERASKKLGSNAGRALSRLRDRLKVVVECMNDARAALSTNRQEAKGQETQP